jgi:hypothetical protein
MGTEGQHTRGCLGSPWRGRPPGAILGSYIAHLAPWAADIRKPANFKEKTSNVHKQYQIQAFAMKSIPNIQIFQSESVGGHENARESR